LYGPILLKLKIRSLLMVHCSIPYYNHLLLSFWWAQRKKPCLRSATADKNPKQMVGTNHPFEILHFAQYDNGFLL